MQILFFCDVSKEYQKIIENLLFKWHKNHLLLKEGDWTLEVLKILSRGYTKSITFLARFGQPDSTRISRVFKVDYLDNSLKEAMTVLRLDKTISAKFFCRIQNDPLQDYWEDHNSGERYGIIEYEYAGDMGGIETVDTLQNFIFDNCKKNPSSYNVNFSLELNKIFDDVIQGLKTKVYQRQVHYNQNGRELYHRKIKHFNLDFVSRHLDQVPQDLKSLFPDSPELLFNTINNSLNLQLDVHYTSPFIHGDLNPTNILVYGGYDRHYGTLIDFLEMENKKIEGFTPYFWDFARLEGELILSFYTNGCFTYNDAHITLSKIINALFNMRSLVKDRKDLMTASDILIRLRNSFFRMKRLHLDISYNSPDVIKAFYYNLLIFFVFVTKFERNEYEVLLGLASAKIIAEQIPQIDYNWVVKKMSDEDNNALATSMSRRSKILFALSFFMTFFTIIIIILSQNFKDDLPVTLLDKARNLMKQELCEESLQIVYDISPKVSKMDSPIFFAKNLNIEGQCYYIISHRQNKEKNLKRAILAHNEAINLLNSHKKDIEYFKTKIFLGMAFYRFSEVRDKESNLLQAIDSFKEAIKLDKNNKLVYAKGILWLGICYRGLSEIRNEVENLKKAIQLVRKSLSIFTIDKYPVDYAFAQNNLGNTFNQLSNAILDRETNIKKAIDAYKQAFKIRTLEKYPYDYAKTQNNISIIYRKQANIREPEKNLERSIQASKEALKIRTYKSYPVDYAVTQTNLGITYVELSRTHNTEKNLQKAINAFQEVLKISRVDKFPLIYAKAKMNIAIAYFKISEIKDEEKKLRLSIQANIDALIIYTSNKYPANYGSIQKQLSLAYRNLSILADHEDGENLNHALSASKNALTIYTYEKYPYEYAEILDSVGHIYWKLAEYQDKEKNLLLAKESFEQALTIFTLDLKKYSYYHTEIQHNLKKLKNGD